MQTRQVTGFHDALEEVEGLKDALTSEDPKVLFETLIAAPLAEVAAPQGIMFIIVDALDELPKDALKKVSSMAEAKVFLITCL